VPQRGSARRSYRVAKGLVPAKLLFRQTAQSPTHRSIAEIAKRLEVVGAVGPKSSGWSSVSLFPAVRGSRPSSADIPTHRIDDAFRSWSGRRKFPSCCVAGTMPGRALGAPRQDALQRIGAQVDGTLASEKTARPLVKATDICSRQSAVCAAVEFSDNANCRLLQLFWSKRSSASG